MDRVLQRRDTASNWAKFNPVLSEGEIGIVIDEGKGYKIGDGVTHWNDLEYPSNPTSVVGTIGDSEVAVINQKGVSSLVGLDTYPVFSDTKPYVKGEIVNYGGLLYEFTADHEAGEWNEDDNESISFKEIINESINIILNQINLIKGKGTSLERPILSELDDGGLFYDTSVKKYICWDGTKWVNMDGSELN
jgi:hypothetical protein